MKMMRGRGDAYSHTHCPDCRGAGCVEVAWLQAEIEWCESNRGKSGKSADFEDGFIAGLRQANLFSDQPSSEQTSKPAFEQMRDALEAIDKMYAHAWDRVDGGLMIMGDSVAKYDKAHAKVRAALAAAKGETK